MEVSREVRVPLGSTVAWPNLCSVCLAASPTSDVRLHAYSVKWSSPATWSLPVASYRVPLCGACRRLRTWRWLVRAFVVLACVAAATFWMEQDPKGSLRGQVPLPQSLVLRVVLTFAVGPLVLWWWRRRPLDARVRLDGSFVVLTFGCADFARAVVVHEPSPVERDDWDEWDHWDDWNRS